MQGTAGAGSSAALVPTLAEQIGKLDVPTEVKQGLIAVAGTAVGAATGEVTGAASGLNQTANNFLLHEEAAKREVAKQKLLQCKDDACRQQAQQEINQWNKLDSWRDEQIRLACATPASVACQSWNAAIQYANVTYKGYDPKTDPNSSIAGERREVNEQAFRYGQQANNPYLVGVGKGLLKLTPQGLVVGVGVGTYALTTAILENGLVDTAINIAKGVKELPGELRARLDSTDPTVRGEALMDVLALAAGGAAVSAKLGQVGGQKFSQVLIKQGTNGIDSTYKAIVSRVPGKVIFEADALNPGNLGNDLSGLPGTFSGGRYATIQLKEPITVYRAWAPGQSRDFGAFWSLEEPVGSLQTRIDSALLPEWGNIRGTPFNTQATQYTTIKLPAGTTIHIGEVGSQGNAWVGGKSQLLIEGGVQPAWKIGEGTLK